MQTQQLPASVHHCTTCRLATYLPTVYRTAPAEPERLELEPPKPSLEERFSARIYEAQSKIDREGKSGDEVARLVLVAHGKIVAELLAEDAAVLPVAGPVSQFKNCGWCGSRTIPRVIEIDPPHQATPVAPVPASATVAPLPIAQDAAAAV